MIESTIIMSSPVASSLQDVESLEKEDAMHIALNSNGEKRKKADTKHASTITENTDIVNNKLMVAGLSRILFNFVAISAIIFGAAVLGTIVYQEIKLSQLEQKINNQSANCSLTGVVPHQLLLEDLQHNNSVLRNKVSVLQAKDILQEERLRVLEATVKEQAHEISPYGNQTEERFTLLETTVADQTNEISSIRNQTEQNEKDFILLDRRLTEEHRILNSSHVEVVSVVETVQKTIAINTLQIETLNSTFIDTHDALRVDLNAALTRTELILSELSSVNRSLEQQKQDTEELRMEARRNISAVMENTQTLINDVISENKETIDGLNSKIDILEATQTSQSEIQVQQGMEIKDLKRNVSDINSNSGLAISGTVLAGIAVIVIVSLMIVMSIGMYNMWQRVKNKQ